MVKSIKISYLYWEFITIIIMIIILILSCSRCIFDFLWILLIGLQGYTVDSLFPHFSYAWLSSMVLDVSDFCQCFEIVNIIRQRMHILSFFTWPYQLCSRYWIFLVVIKPGLHPVQNQVPQIRFSWPKGNIPILFILQTACLCYWTLIERWHYIIHLSNI